MRASIQIDKVSEDQVWTWLNQLDAIFTRELPPNEAAIRLYSHWIGKYMEQTNAKFAEDYAVVADATSSTGGPTPDRLVFEVVRESSGPGRRSTAVSGPRRPGLSIAR